MAEAVSLEALLRDPLTRTRWMERHRVGIVADRYLSLNDDEPYTLYAVRVLKGRGTSGPVGSVPEGWYDVLQKWEGVTHTTAFGIEQEALRFLFHRVEQKQ